MCMSCGWLSCLSGKPQSQISARPRIILTGNFNYSPNNLWESRGRLFYCCPRRGRLRGMPQNIAFLRDKPALLKLRSDPS